jgi:FkbH-like protein
LPPENDFFNRRLPEPARAAVAEAFRDGTWSKVRRALSALNQCPVERQGPEVRVQILASFEIESIEPALRLGLSCIPCRPTLRIAPLNTIEQELLDRNSTASSQPGLAAVVLWRADELVADMFHPFSTGGHRKSAEGHLESCRRIATMIEGYLSSSSVPLFFGTLPLPAAPAALGGSRPQPALAGAIAAVNAEIFRMAAKHPSMHVLDVNWWAAQEGRSYYDQQMDFMAKQPLTTKAAISFGFFLARSLRPLIAPRHKVLVVDLDNTLWGGILEEDGLAGLKLGHDSPGSVYLRIQREIAELKKQGVLLVLASKNDEASVRKALQTVPNMLLSWDDFVSQKVNFENKYSNLREVAGELGLSLDSFAFLDDSDFEREQMKAFNPEVLILNDHGSGLRILSSLQQTDAFDTHRITDEDLARHREYELRSARKAPSADDLTGFLSSLQLRAVLERFSADNYDRVAQMLGKTNQFNLTTRRHSIDELRRLAGIPGAVTLALKLSDRFGDQGIVGVLMAVPEDAGSSLSVDTFLVSCRALSRGVEEVLWAELANWAASAGIKRIVGIYQPTAKNGIVAGHYDKLGLVRTEDSPLATSYLLEPPRTISFPQWIEVDRTAL